MASVRRNQSQGTKKPRSRRGQELILSTTSKKAQPRRISGNAVVLREPPSLSSSDDDEPDNSEEEEEVEKEKDTVAKRKGKKLMKPRQRRKPQHIPPEHLLLPGREDLLPHGIPNNPEVLIGYADSWAAKIFETADTYNAVRFLRHQTCSDWDLNGEVDEVVALVQKTPLWRAIFYAQTEYDKVTVSAFIERFWPETKTFHFTWGELGFVVTDPKKILGLPCVGKKVHCPEMTFEQLYKEAEDALGWDEKHTDNEFKRARREAKDGESIESIPSTERLRAIKFTTLFNEFRGSKKRVEDGEFVMDEARIKHTASAYLLYQLGSFFFPDNSGNRLNAHYLHFVKDLTKMHEYAWGPAVLGFLLVQLSSASRMESTNLGGNFSLLQGFIYDHFPELNLADTKEPLQLPSWEEGLPTSAKYKLPKQKKGANKVEQLVDLRRKLDNLHVSKVVFDPYYGNEDVMGGNDEERQERSVRMYHGPLHFVGGFALYDPRRILRQLGCVQREPYADETGEKYKLLGTDEKARRTRSTLKNWAPQYEPDPSFMCWENRLDNLISQQGIRTLGEDPTQIEEGYIDWYNQISHPLIINPAAQVVTDAERDAKEKKKKKMGSAALARQFEGTLAYVVNTGRKLLKQMNTRMCQRKPMGKPEQQAWINKWSQLINEVDPDTELEPEPIATIMPSKRQKGEGSIVGRGGDGSSSGGFPDDEGGAKSRGDRGGAKRGRNQ